MTIESLKEEIASDQKRILARSRRMSPSDIIEIKDANANIKKNESLIDCINFRDMFEGVSL